MLAVELPPMLPGEDEPDQAVRDQLDGRSFGFSAPWEGRDPSEPAFAETVFDEPLAILGSIHAELVAPARNLPRTLGFRVLGAERCLVCLDQVAHHLANELALPQRGTGIAARVHDVRPPSVTEHGADRRQGPSSDF